MVASATAELLSRDSPHPDAVEQKLRRRGHIPSFVTPREEQPERRIYSAPGAMGNPEGVSYKAKPF